MDAGRFATSNAPHAVRRRGQLRDASENENVTRKAERLRPGIADAAYFTISVNEAATKIAHGRSPSALAYQPMYRAICATAASFA